MNYLVYDGTNIEIKETTPYLELCLDLRAAGYLITNTYVLNHIGDIIDDLLETLSENEGKVLKMSYGLDSGKKNQEEEIALALDLLEEEVSTIFNKGIRKLRHPSRFKHLRNGIPNPSGQAVLYNSNYYRLVFLDVLKSELKYFVDGNTRQTLYLGRILERNGMSLNIKSKANEEVKNIPLDDLGLSLRAYNCLKRAGKNSLHDLLKMTEDDFMKVRNLGRKSLDEIEMMLARMATYDKDPYLTIECVKNGEITFFKYADSDIDRISDSLYRTLYDTFGKNIFACEFSPELVNRLLMKGFFAEDDIYASANDLIEYFNECGEQYLARELESWLGYKERVIECLDAMPRVLVKINNDVLETIIEKGINTLEDLTIFNNENEMHLFDEFIEMCVETFE